MHSFATKTHRPAIRTTEQTWTVAVRELCEFAAKTGDLDHRFTPSPSAQEGIAGHGVVAARRGASRRSEWRVAGNFRQLHVRGRIDGFDADQQLLEEVKTYRGDLSRMPANHRSLHWAQAKVYGALLCAQLGLPTLKISLVYFEIGRQEETVLVEACKAEDLQRFFASLCESFLAWARGEIEHRRHRDRALAQLRFAHVTYRAGQRRLAVNVFKAARLGRCLMAQAPTGIGKTIGVVFPLLKACASDGLDKIFFLTAKGSGQASAAAAIEALRRGHPALPLRVIELVSRDKACEHPDKSCHGDSCPLARGFYDRLPAARREAVDGDGLLNHDTLRRVARQHAVCPYYLSQELVRWSDVVIGDYNYFFDTSAMLHSLTLVNEWKVAVLVDEAHNLLDRARGMYSAALSQARLDEVAAAAPASLRPSLARLQRIWQAMTEAQTAPYAVHAGLPERLLSALDAVTAAVGDERVERPADVDADLLRFYFDALHFGRLAESFAAHSLFDCSVEAEGSRQEARRTTLCIRNVVPAAFLRPRYEAARACVLFSATLSPPRFYADMLGLPESHAWLDVEPPFTAEQLAVHLVRHIPTRFARRGASLAPIARLIAAQYAGEPGNYLAFFSSFDYLEQAADVFRSLSPQTPCWQQERRSSATDREAFLRRFTSDGSGVGFAVLGGSFSEGIDLPGKRLIGAFIATLGLPQLNPVNEEMKRRLHTTFGAGHAYAYLYPGLRKVVQAAGRVIRTPLDRGSLYLIDDRYGLPEVRALLPAWWQTSGVGGPASRPHADSPQPEPRPVFGSSAAPAE